MDIDMIEIIENKINIIIFPKKRKLLINNNYYPISEEKVYDFIRIIRNWNKEYSDTGYLDGNYFEINVYYDDKIDRMRGIRGVPDNYQEFANFIRSIYDGR